MKYEEEHKVELQLKKKQYRQEHLSYILEKGKQYREGHKEKCNQYSKEYYKVNKNKMLEQFTCDCGSIVAIMGKNRHERNRKHKAWLLNNTNI